MARQIEAWKAQWAALTPEDRRFGLLRGIGVLILIGIPVFLFLHPKTGMDVVWPGGRLVWTHTIALVPLAIVAVGFYTWRKICPLAFFGRMSEWLGWPDRPGTRGEERRRRRVPKWLARNYPYVTWGFLAAMLAFRILLLNSNATAMAFAFVGLMALAALTSFRYTGKTWCNFFCPVYTIEMLYTEGDRPQYRRNSQCPNCTGCKTVPSGGLCPDINQENDYWQELKNPARAFAYYAFPGLVLGFYVWYFVHQPYYWHQRQGQVIHGELVPVQQPGTLYDWGYYLSGDWTRDPHPWTHWLEPGFGLSGWPDVPTFVAAPLTLAVFAALSYLLFRVIEAFWFKLKTRRGTGAPEALEAVRHPLFAWAGFTAFTIFYTFAGAPTWRYLPFGLYGLFHFGVVVLAAWVLHTRLSRTRVKQLQFDQARKWVKKWPFADEAPPIDLDQAYTKYTLRMQFSEHRLRAFKEAVRHTLGESLITVGELNLLDRLAADLGVSEEEEKKVIREIGKEVPELFDTERQGRLRDRLQLFGYRAELERALSENRGIFPDGVVLAEMQARYCVQPAEHDEVLKELRDPAGPHAALLQREVEDLQRLRGDAAVLAAYPAPSIDFLLHEVEARLHESRDHVRQMLSLYAPSSEPDGLAPGAREEGGAERGPAARPGPGGYPRSGSTLRAPAPGPRGVRDMSSQPNIGDLTTGELAGYPLAGELRRHLPADLAEAVVEALCAPAHPQAGTRSAVDTSPAALTRVLLRLSDHSDLYIRAAALYSLWLVAGGGTVNPEACRPDDQAAARARAEQALQDSHSLVLEAAVAALAPHLSRDQWSAVLQDFSVAVRRAAIRRVPRPVPPEIVDLVARARGDSDDQVWRAAAAAGDNVEARWPNGRPLPSLTILEKMFALRKSDVLGYMSAEKLHFLAERTEEEVFEPGEALCTEGESADSVYILIEGQTEAVKQRGGQAVRLGVHRPGECVGEMALLGDPGSRYATVRALDAPVRVLTIHGEDFRHLLGRDAGTSLRVMRLIINRQRQELPPA